MTTFIQLHMLTFYPPSNLNRDELGRPKTAVVGGSTRLRISSQSLKRAWRTADIFERAMDGNMGIRTKEIGIQIKASLRFCIALSELIRKKESLFGVPETSISDEDATRWAAKIASIFVDKKKGVSTGEGDLIENADGNETEDDSGKKGSRGRGKKAKSNINSDLRSEQLVFYSWSEIAEIEKVVEQIKIGKKPSDEEVASLLCVAASAGHSPDVAMFGRMLANAPKQNVEAAVQVAHAFTVHEVAVEEDYFTAVDDLNKGDEDRGAAHLGETEFGSGLFYGYICVNRDLLAKNLNGDEALARKALRSLVETGAQVAPRGKQNSFASHAKAHYILSEKGSQQPRSLALAFADGIPMRNGKGDRILENAKGALEDKRKKMDAVYGACADAHRIMDLETGEGTLNALLDFITE